MKTGEQRGMVTVANDLADWLESHPRDRLDLDAADMLRKLERVYAAAFDMVYARTDTASKAAYAELVHLIKGKQND